MHIIIAIISLATTIFIVYRRFNESGLASTLNPFLFFRRRAWNQRRETNPLFILDNNKDIASALFFIIAKLDGELTKESKLALQNDYQQLLHMDADEASATLQQNSFILEQYPIIRSDLKKILHRNCVAQFSSAEAYQLTEHLPIIASREGVISKDQQEWIADIAKLLAPVQGQIF